MSFPSASFNFDFGSLYSFESRTSFRYTRELDEFGTSKPIVPLPGTGAIAEYGELGNFGVRIVMSYDPNTLAQQFTVDCLYGVGVLRNVYGVAVLS